jgi:hypothetical protein
MNDVQTGKDERRKKLGESPFFTFSKPYLEFLDKGKFFNFIYVIMAVANLIIPFSILYRAIDSPFFGLGPEFVFAFFFVWLSIVFSCWIGFQLWWDRRKKVTNIGSSEFIATTIFSEILQTFGEWLGTFVGIVGASGGLIASIFLGENSNYLFSIIGMGFMQFGVLTVIIGPIIGFLSP